jgi:hypothetical protein
LICDITGRPMKKKTAPKSGYRFFPSISPMREGLYYTYGSLGSLPGHY